MPSINDLGYQSIELVWYKVKINHIIHHQTFNASLFA